MYLKVMPLLKTILSLLVISTSVVAQTASYQILTFPFGSRSAAMGDTRAADPSGSLDINSNPANTSFIERTQSQASYINHLVGIKGYAVMGALPMDRHRLSGEVIYFDYGLFDETDVSGNTLSTFGFHELSSAFGYSFVFSETIRMGGRLGSYQRFADGDSQSDLYYDLGAIYHDDEDSLTVGLYIASVGVGDSHETFPTELRLGSSKILSHLPLRLNVEGVYALEDRFHFSAGGEILIHPRLRVRLGIHSNRFDLQTGVTASDFIAGSTGGLVLVWDDFQIDMAAQSFGAAGWINQLTIAFQL